MRERKKGRGQGGGGSGSRNYDNKRSHGADDEDSLLRGENGNKNVNGAAGIDSSFDLFHVWKGVDLVRIGAQYHWQVGNRTRNGGVRSGHAGSCCRHAMSC